MFIDLGLHSMLQQQLERSKAMSTTYGDTTSVSVPKLLDAYELNRLAGTLEEDANPLAKSILTVPAKLEQLRDDPAVPQITEADNEFLSIAVLLANLFIPILFRKFAKPKAPSHK